ncbi:hypothetical protein [Crateriforma spongiae]|uniref:hypothetical protein n=1 Tax=Crateriforma spongiae TaxID=2724528 RepID=UPI0014469FD4|nr:hypothetical protein [Crateriforma spongiae]
MTRPAYRTAPRVYVFRNGQELTDHPANGRNVLGFGRPVGMIGNAVCFDSVTVRTAVDAEFTQADFGGPVSVKIWSPGRPAVWFGIADVQAVEAANESRREAVTAN